MAGAAPPLANHTPVASGRARSARTSALRWRLIRDEPLEGARNMALDHALAERLGKHPVGGLENGEGIVRLYSWSRPTVSWGKNEPAAAPISGLDYVRRPTGGRAVLHDDELTYAVVAPVDAFGGLRQAYVEINRVIAAAIGALGVTVSVAGDGDTVAVASSPLDGGACFQTPARGEIVAGGRKLVGSAQARLGGSLLQHGSILLGGTQGRMGPVDAEPATLSKLLGPVSRDALADRLKDMFRVRLGGRWVEEGYRGDELEAAERLERDRYGRDTWTWRTRRESI